MSGNKIRKDGNMATGIYKGVARDFAKRCDKGFLYEKDFTRSKRFSRFRSKVSDYMTQFMRDITGMQGSASDIMAAFFAFWVYDGMMSDPEEKDLLGGDAFVMIDDAVAGKIGDKIIADALSGALRNNAESIFSGWRNHLVPLPSCDPYNYAKSDPYVKKGWRGMMSEKGRSLAGREKDQPLWDALFDTSFSTACELLLRERYFHGEESRKAEPQYKRYDEIDDGNFCVKALLDGPGDAMTFMILLENLVWIAGYSTFVWAQQERTDGLLAEERHKKRADALEEENADLKAKLDNLSNTIVPRLKREIRDARIEGGSDAEAKLKDYISKSDGELSAERKKSRQADAEIERLKSRVKDLEDQLAVWEDSEDDSIDDAADIELNSGSRIVFIACPPANSRIQNTFDRIAKMFPNSKFVFDTADLNMDGDCYVLLTRYLTHHGEYWRAKDFIKAHDLPCIHTGYQNAERIYRDIAGKARFSGK